ncbi:MAG: hypothetical protein VB087_10905 [Candidatus Limiplasma sp.]|nr:hypothetical protein [Candidatus Limiplasma sp.]
MQRLLSCVLALCLCAAVALPALAQAAPVETEPLVGTVPYPAGSDAATAPFVLTYRYPQFAGDTPALQAINAYFGTLAADAPSMAAGAAAAAGELPVAGAPAYYVALDYRIAYAGTDYLSVLQTASQFLGVSETERWSADVFALDGVYAGQPVTLTQALGLEQQNADAAQASFAADLLYRLVWEIIQQEAAMQTRAYFPDATEADLRAAFDPEQDFYLDGDGNFVFFVQPGVVAPELEGVLSYPFSLAELLSAAR